MAAIGAQLGDPQLEPEPEPEPQAPRRRGVKATPQTSQPRRSSRLSQRSATSAAASAADEPGDYIAAAAFSGPLVGYEFKSGPYGLGYYQMEFLKQSGAAQLEQSPRGPPSRMSSASAAPSRASSRPGTSASSASLDSEWVFAINSMASNCEIRQQSRMSHRGGNVMTWADPGSQLSPIGESATPSQQLAADTDQPLGQTGQHPWQPRAPWNDAPASGSTPKHGRRVIQPKTAGETGSAQQGLGAAGVIRHPATPGYGKLP